MARQSASQVMGNRRERPGPLVLVIGAAALLVVALAAFLGSGDRRRPHSPSRRPDRHLRANRNRPARQPSAAADPGGEPVGFRGRALPPEHGEGPVNVDMVPVNRDGPGLPPTFSTNTRLGAHRLRTGPLGTVHCQMRGPRLNRRARAGPACPPYPQHDDDDGVRRYESQTQNPVGSTCGRQGCAAPCA